MKFYKCAKCGQMVGAIKETACDVFCCGQAMEELIPGTTDAAVEKHVPVYTVEGSKVSVKVGSVEHPMIDVHYIEWIVVETNFGSYTRKLSPNTPPAAEFNLVEGEVVKEVYAYCNLHSLWKA
jgi:superoxide reductase